MAQTLSEADLRFREKERELSIIRRLGDSLRAVTSFEEVCKKIVETVADETGAENCSLMLFDEDTQSLVLRAAKGQSDSSCRFLGDSGPFTSFKLGHGVAGWVAQEKEPLLVTNVDHEERFDRLDDTKVEIKSLLSLPLVSRDDILGVINLSHPQEGTFTEKKKRMLSLVADQSAIALANVQMFHQLEELNRDLEEKVSQRTEKLKQLNNELTETTVRLIQSEKLACLGELITGVTHELNNKLTPILAYAQLLQKMDVESNTLRCLKTIENSAQGAKTIMESLLSLARPTEPAYTHVDINETLKQTISLVEYRIQAGNIKLELDFDQNLPWVWADSNQMAQVFLNIINNACDAMREQGGRLQITSGKTADHVRIEISDTGQGIAEEHIDRMFDPFFSTKDAGKGTGLGLSLSQRLVEAHSGSISVQSTLGEGATFIIKLPADECASPPPKRSGRKKKPKTNKKPVRGETRALSDDTSVRKMAARTLSPNHDASAASDDLRAMGHMINRNSAASIYVSSW